MKVGDRVRQKGPFPSKQDGEVLAIDRDAWGPFVTVKWPDITEEADPRELEVLHV